MAKKKPINMEVGERIRSRRERNGWTRDYLAEITDFSVRYVGMIEVGTAGVSLEGLRLFSDKLGVSVDYLLNGAKDKHFRNISGKLAELQELDKRHIENIEVLIDTYIKGTEI